MALLYYMSMHKCNCAGEQCTINTEASLIKMRYTRLCMATANLNAMLIKCFLPLANSNLHLPIARHWMHYTAKTRVSWMNSYILQALPYKAGTSVFFIRQHTNKTHLPCTDKPGCVDFFFFFFLARDDPRVSKRKGCEDGTVSHDKASDSMLLIKPQQR